MEITFLTVRQFEHAIADIRNEYGEQAATGTLTVMYNRLRAAGIDNGPLFDYVDRTLASRTGWDMDKAGYLYMV